ncbi:MAG: hypothetical protein K0U98_01075 [Deltaproteobacteria bacterium]|nr:hypothetical protein [Deltaproteobacteria bacterium]
MNSNFRCRIRISCLCLTALLLLPFTARANDLASEGPDHRAETLVEKTLQAMGGEEAWDATRFISFSFAGFRTHHWDRELNRHRLEGKKRDGDSYVVLLDLETREGSAWLNGEVAQGTAAEELLEMAYGAWINDTYWLVMPYKLRDPGVTLKYEDKEKLGEVTYDKVRMTFDGVGLTPGDTYWVYFNPETGLVDHWSYILESYEEGRPPTFWTWEGWQRFGKVMLPTEHAQAGSDRKLPMQNVAVYDDLPDAVFESPAAISEPDDPS